MKKDSKIQGNLNSFFAVNNSELNELLIIETIMNNSQDTIYFKDKNSNFILSSKAHALLFDIENPVEVIGKSDFDYFPVDFSEKAYKDEQTIIATGVPIIGRIEKLIKPDGCIIWLSASKYPLYDFNGEIIGTWGTSRDITSLKRAEEELRHLNAKLEEANRQLRVLSAIDSLSGLYNHRHFFAELTKTFELYTRKRQKKFYEDFVIILFDIDNFKNINDTYGHLMGDFVIRHVSEIIKTNTRSADSCFRYGGDEFVILLLDTTLEVGKEIAEKLRKIIVSKPIITKHAKLNLTVSMGVASFAETTNVGQIIEKADKRLYQSKNQGKNRIN